MKLSLRDKIFMEGMAMAAIIAYNHNGADYPVAREILNSGGIDEEILPFLKMDIDDEREILNILNLGE